MQLFLQRSKYQFQLHNRPAFTRSFFSRASSPQPPSHGIISQITTHHHNPIGSIIINPQLHHPHQHSTTHPLPSSSSHHKPISSRFFQGSWFPIAVMNSNQPSHYQRDVDTIISSLNYNIRLPAQFQANFLRLGADGPTRQFLTEAVRKYNRCFFVNWGVSTLRTVLGYCMHHTDIIGFLNVGLMHIISAKQLQLLLQHSYTVEQPLNSESFKKFDFPNWLDSLKTKQAGQIINGNFIHRNDNNSIKPNNRQLQSSKSTAPKSKTKLAGSLLGVEIHSDDDDDDDDETITALDDDKMNQHILNLDAIFGAKSTNVFDIETGVPQQQQQQNQPNTNPLKFNQTALSFNGLVSPETAQEILQGKPTKQSTTYHSVMFGQDLNNLPDYLQDETLLPVKYGTMLDVGAGSGRMAELLSPVFDQIECTEVSEQMVKLIQSKGFPAYYIDNLDNMPGQRKYDVVCLFNLIDRCDEPISLLYQLHQRLRPQLQQHRDSLLQAGKIQQQSGTLPNFADSSIQFDSNQTTTITSSQRYTNLNGRVVIAVPLPLKPSVEMTLEDSSTSWRTPKENIAPKQCWCCVSFEESLQHLVTNIIEPCGYDVLTISRLPYLSEGNLYHTHFTLEDIVLVCAPKPEWTP